jgi:16S rRNA (cytosine967-C5)-methyltransferase
MTPGARIQAAIELIDQVLQAWTSQKRIPADKMLEGYFKSHRYIGSKDRGAISELVYWVLRHRASIEWWLDRENQRLYGRSFVLAAIVLRKDYNPQTILSLPKDSQFSPPPFTDDEIKFFNTLVRFDLQHPDMPDHVRLNYPQWMDGILHQALGDNFEAEILALNAQAPTDLRVNTLKTTREKLLETLNKEGFECTPTPVSPVGIRLAKRGPIFTSETFKKGHFEVQDEGSQIVAQLVDAQSGQRVIDFCAGAGGKTLAMAADMKNKGTILAWDTSEKRLLQTKPRIRRAGIDNVQTHVITSEHDAFIKRHKGTADRVLVDAPCSGSGTWRRNPDLKWRFTQHDLDEVSAIQQTILQSAARLVKPGGRIIYATCSILKEENDHQIAKFLTSVNNFRVVCAEKVWNKNTSLEDSDAVSYLALTPHKDGVDGFFAAVLVRAKEPKELEINTED